MQVNKFIQYLDNSTLISSLKEDEFKPLLEQFPYCQTGQLLQAVVFKKNNSILFEQQLKTAASYCTDRKKLFEHLNHEPQNDSIKKIDKEAQIDSIVELKDEVVKTSEIDILEKEYLTAAISSSIFLDVEKEQTEIKKSVQEEEIIEVNLFDTKTEHSFSDWLKHFNGDVIENSDGNEPLTIQSKIDLIDKFIQEDPKIKPLKQEFYSPTNMARLSVTDDSDIVSETLALVYVDQGKYQEAIKAYQKLSLKNPEKRSYFASQIKILNQKLK